MSDQVLPYKGIMPKIADDVYVAPGARVVGDVEIGPGSSVWFNTVIRGDVNSVRIGARTNIQDGSVVHESGASEPTVIGDDVLIGHMVLLHSCLLKDRCLIGMGAIVMDNVTVGEEAMVAAGALVTPGKTIEPRTLWGGSPAKYMRDLTDDEIAHNQFLTRNYATRAQEYGGDK